MPYSRMLFLRLLLATMPAVIASTPLLRGGEMPVGMIYEHARWLMSPADIHLMTVAYLTYRPSPSRFCLLRHMP